MGRAIAMEKDIESLRKDIDQLKSAFEGLASTVETLQDTAPAKKTIDLHEYEDEKPEEIKETEVEETEVEEVVEDVEQASEPENVQEPYDLYAVAVAAAESALNEIESQEEQS